MNRNPGPEGRYFETSAFKVWRTGANPFVASYVMHEYYIWNARRSWLAVVQAATVTSRYLLLEHHTYKFSRLLVIIYPCDEIMNLGA